MTDSKGHKFPFELIELIFNAVEFPQIDDGTFDDLLESTRWDNHLPVSKIKRVKQQHAQRQTRVIEDLLLVCKPLSRVLMSSLEAHLHAVECCKEGLYSKHSSEEFYSRHTQTELEEEQCEDDVQSCADPLEKCFDMWEDYLTARVRYVRRLLRHFEEPQPPKWHNLPHAVRGHILSLVLQQVSGTVREHGAHREERALNERDIRRAFFDVRQAVLQLRAVSTGFSRNIDRTTRDIKAEFRLEIMYTIVAQYPGVEWKYEGSRTKRTYFTQAYKRRTTMESFGSHDHLLDLYNLAEWRLCSEHCYVGQGPCESHVAELPRYHWNFHPAWRERIEAD